MTVAQHHRHHQYLFGPISIIEYCQNFIMNMGVNNKIISSLLLWLLLLCAVVIPTSPSKYRPTSDVVVDSRGARTNKKWKEARHRSSTSATTTSSSSHYGGPPRREEGQPSSSDRRVIPWVSIAILMNILFFFRSFAAPFFDPLVSVWFALIIIKHLCRVYSVGSTRNSRLLVSISLFLHDYFSIGRTTSSHRLLRLLFSTCLPLPVVSLRDSINGTSSVLYQLQYHHCGGIVLLHGIR